MNNIESREWADETFGRSNLGDPRRTARLIDYARRQADDPAASTFGSCGGDVAASEGAYRFLRNDYVDPKAIDIGVNLSTAKLCKGLKLVLAIQDSTSVEVAHVPLRKELEREGCPTGFMVHSTIMVNGESGFPIGLMGQERWTRPKEIISESESVVAEKKRVYTEKESYRWETASREMVDIMGDVGNVITVCDREADIYEFLQYHQDNELRYIVRAAQDRRLAKGSRLWQAMEEMPILGYREIQIEQRGPWKPQFESLRPGRKARKATLAIHAGTTKLLWPKNDKPKEARPVVVNVVYVREVNPPEGHVPLVWKLLTTEPVDSLEAASFVVSCYEKRWIIEEFHKSWKVGCRLEERPLQSLKAVERQMAISAPIGIRLLQFQYMAEAEPDAPCDKLLTKEEWQCLCAITNPGKALPKKPPTNSYVYYAIAKMGGWMDTKRNGRVGWQSIWKGWHRFQDKLHGWRIARSAYGGAQSDL